MTLEQFKRADRYDEISNTMSKLIGQLMRFIHAGELDSINLPELKLDVIYQPDALPRSRLVVKFHQTVIFVKNDTSVVFMWETLCERVTTKLNQYLALHSLAEIDE